jgi:TonB family protein
MFDFAVSQNQKKRPTRRLVAAGITSCLTHVAVLAIIAHNPWLLSGGLFRDFQGLRFIPALLQSEPEDERENFRTVTVLRPMFEPSAETLKKYAYNWNKKGEKDGTPPVRVRWGGELAPAAKKNEPATPIVPPQPKPVPPAREAAGIAAAGQGSQNPAAKSPSEDASSGIPKAVQIDPTKKGTVTLPPPSPSAKSEVAAIIAPSSIPNSIKQPSGAEARPGDNQQQTVRREGIALFDTKDFPLGDYADQIKDRIYGNWFIPSSLKNSQGNTTVIFYIDRNGRYTDARIVSSSGNYSLNLAALNAILNSNPFPPLPQGFPGDHIGVRYIFSYNEPQ